MGYLTHKIIPEMTYDVPSRMLNPSIPILGQLTRRLCLTFTTRVI